MSKSAPWLALAIDWMDSEMLDDSSHGERLAWICLLCFAKAQGRAGRVRFRGKKFAENYRLSMESVEAMVQRATMAGAITVEGDVVTVVNWKDYQDPRDRGKPVTQTATKKGVAVKPRPFIETASTTHPPPSTQHTSPTTTWAAAAVLLRVCGVERADDACEAAKSNSVSPAEVQIACEHFNRFTGAWSPGLLYSIVCRMRGGEKVSWPPVSEKFAEQCRAVDKQMIHNERLAAIAREHREREERKAEKARILAETANEPSILEKFEAVKKASAAG